MSLIRIMTNVNMKMERLGHRPRERWDRRPQKIVCYRQTPSLLRDIHDGLPVPPSLPSEARPIRRFRATAFPGPSRRLTSTKAGCSPSLQSHSIASSVSPQLPSTPVAPSSSASTSESPRSHFDSGGCCLAGEASSAWAVRV